MIAFWSLVCLMTAGALLFVVPTLWRQAASRPDGAALAIAVYRRELEELDADMQADRLTADTHAVSRRELEQRLLEDTAGGAVAPRAHSPGGRTGALLVLAGLPVSAVAIYLAIGHPQAVTFDRPSGAAPQTVDARTAGGRLAPATEGTAEAARAWYEQARAHMAAGDHVQAVEAYAKTVALLPGSAALLAEYAEAIALTQGRDLRGRPAEIVRAALEIDPRHPRSLALAATAAYASRDYRGAIVYWERLQATLPPNSDNARTLVANIARARSAAVGQPAVAASQPSTAIAAATVDAATAVGPGALSGTVHLSPALQTKVQPQAVLFVYARLEDGPRTPLAVVRMAAQGLPSNFVLDDAAAMDPTRTLSTARTNVTLGARISQTGDPVPRSGDLQGFARGVRVGQTGIEILVDSVVP